MEAVSLSELNRYIQRVFSLNFTENMWVRAEIGQLGHSRGHYYIDFIEKNTDGSVAAKLQGALWKTQYNKLVRKHGSLLQDLLREGIEILVNVTIEFHEIFGLKLIIEDVDPAFTFGKLELQRQEIINTLEKEKRIERNGYLPLPSVLQRIAVISSPTAAGFQDFQKQLEHNEYQYHFNLSLFPAAMQGSKVETEVLMQMERINKQVQNFDCLVIIRGGGSKLDLADFDNLDIARTISEMKIPVISGIGHERDETIVDMVAHTALKTPTAVAEFIIQRSLLFESSILEYWANIEFFTRQEINQNRIGLQQLESAVKHFGKAAVNQQNHRLELMENRFPQILQLYFQKKKHQLESLENIVQVLDPKTILKRGYSITTDQEGHTLQSAEQVQNGEMIKTVLYNGVISSKIEKIEK